MIFASALIQFGAPANISMDPSNWDFALEGFFYVIYFFLLLSSMSLLSSLLSLVSVSFSLSKDTSKMARSWSSFAKKKKK